MEYTLTMSASKKSSPSPRTPFEKVYATLNTEQKRAVDTIQGPVMIIAGPGTGKTHIMAVRIAHILQRTDVGARGVLALTFTESAVSALRKRLISIIGETGYQVPIYTFHGFCNTLIARFPEAFDTIIGAQPSTDIDTVMILQSIIEARTAPTLKPFGDPLYYVSAVRSTITELKREAVSPEALHTLYRKQLKAFDTAPDKLHVKGAHKGKVKSEYIEQKKYLERTRELIDIYTEYQDALRTKKLYDYEDTLIETITALKKDPDMLATLQEEFQYVLADEHQDANQSQNSILELLTGYDDSPNICIVGDDKQAVFRFQGASLENFLYFKKKFPKSQIITLTNNYRSQQRVLDAAHGLSLSMQQNELGERALLTGAAPHAAPLSIISYAHPTAEVAATVAAVASINPQETVAVIFRENAEAEPYVQELSARDIAHTRVQSSSMFTDPWFRHAVALLRVVVQPTHDEALAEVLLNPLWDFSPVIVHEALDTARKSRTALHTVVSSADAPAALGTMYATLVRLSSYARVHLVRDALITTLNESGFPEHIARDPDGSLHVVYQVLLAEVESLSERNPHAGLGDFVQHLDTLVEHNIRIHIPTRAHEARVTLLTAHRSKGLEFDHVYIVGATDRRWGAKVSRSSFDIPVGNLNRSGRTTDDDDERRLLYVAITRAKKTCTISYSRARPDGSEEYPSRFIAELPLPHIMERVDTAIVLPTKRSTQSQSAAAYLQELRAFYQKKSAEHSIDRGLSPTSLNRFLRCPWEYMFVDVFSLPEPSSVSQFYGIAMHATLKMIFDTYATGKKVTSAQAIVCYKTSLAAQPISAAELSSLIERGTAIFKKYIAATHERWVKDNQSEYKVSRVHVPGVPVFLRGTIDKIETRSDGSVTIIDYKSRKPQSLTADYKRQLAFYVLLLTALPNAQSVHAACIEFLEPDAQGAFIRKELALTDETLSVLKKEIIAMVSSLEHLSFWNDRCADSACRYCHLATALQTKLNR